MPEECFSYRKQKKTAPVRSGPNMGLKYRSLYGEGVDLQREGALQVAGLVLVDHTTLGQLINLTDDAGQLLSGCRGVGQRLEVANGITGGLALVPVACPAFGYLTDILLRSLMICHVLSFLNFRTAKVWNTTLITKSIRFFQAPSKLLMNEIPWEGSQIQDEVL